MARSKTKRKKTTKASRKRRAKLQRTRRKAKRSRNYAIAAATVVCVAGGALLYRKRGASA